MWIIAWILSRWNCNKWFTSITWIAFVGIVCVSVDITEWSIASFEVWPEWPWWSILRRWSRFEWDWMRRGNEKYSKANIFIHCCSSISHYFKGSIGLINPNSQWKVMHCSFCLTGFKKPDKSHKKIIKIRNIRFSVEHCIYSINVPNRNECLRRFLLFD